MYFGIFFQLSTHNKTMKKSFITLAIAASALALAIAIALSISTSSVVPTHAPLHQYNYSQKITVVGNSTVMVPPDFADISLSIETTHKTSEAAQKENTKIVVQLLKALDNQNISKEDIRTSWFAIYPEYDYSFGSQRHRGYRVSNQLSIRLRDTNSVGKIIDTATAAGANIISGVHFGIEDNSDAYSQALIKALESAKQKAVALSEAAGFGAMKIISITESSFNHVGLARMHYDVSCGASHTHILHNDIGVSATVEVTFGN